jgi:hypothetical protein
VWNEELALLAEGFAAKCVAVRQADQNPRSQSFENIGRNFYVLSDLDLENKVNFSTIIGVWFSESSNYNYNDTTCSGSSCDNYTQVYTSASKQLLVLTIKFYPFIVLFCRWCRRVLTSLVVDHFIVKYLFFTLVSKDAFWFVTMHLGRFYL